MKWTISPMQNRAWLSLFFILAVLLSMSTPARAQDTVGYLRVDGVDSPRQVVPASTYEISVKFSYAFHEEHQVKAAVYAGSVGNLNAKLWESGSMTLAERGSKILTAKLEAPSDETTLKLTVYAMILNKTWAYFSDEEKGPGFKELSVKVSELARFMISLGYVNVSLVIDGRSVFTNGTGQLSELLSIANSHTVTLPETIVLGDRSRAVFQGWSDGENATSRSFRLDGDSTLEASYRRQHFVEVKSPVGTTSGTGWYFESDVAHFAAPSVVGFEGTFGWLGAKHVFQSWKGDSSIPSPGAAMVVDGPKVVEALYRADYSDMWSLGIVVAGAALGLVLGSLLLGRRRAVEAKQVEPTGPPAEPLAWPESETIPPSVATKFCVYCASGVEPNARFCDKCGRSQNH